MAIGVLIKTNYSYYTSLYTIDTTVHTAVSIVLSNAVRAERSEDRHRMTPIGVLRDTAVTHNDSGVGCGCASQVRVVIGARAGERELVSVRVLSCCRVFA